MQTQNPILNRQEINIMTRENTSTPWLTQLAISHPTNGTETVLVSTRRRDKKMDHCDQIIM